MGRSRRHSGAMARGITAQKTAFRPEYLDFDRGIRVGHLEPGERITRIIKARLEERHSARMICDRWGRGVYWQWICWVPEPNRRAKPVSSRWNFSSAKFFVSIDREERVFQSGIQIERAPTQPAEDARDVRIEKDWDWHVLLRELRGRRLPALVRGHLREGFRVRVGPFDSLLEFDRRSWDLAACLKSARARARSQWGGFQLFWPMKESEVRATPGPELIEATLAVFQELTPAMNVCMGVPCLRTEGVAP